jgi:hypothetical protein
VYIFVCKLSTRSAGPKSIVPDQRDSGGVGVTALVLLDKLARFCGKRREGGKVE